MKEVNTRNTGVDSRKTSSKKIKLRGKLLELDLVFRMWCM